MPQAQTFAAGLDFIRRNRGQDNWFLQIETFDPHEPFFSDRKYKDLYAKHYDRYKGRPFDWPPLSRRSNETARGGRALPPRIRGPAEHVRRPPGQGAGPDGRAGPVEGHDADREHRPRLPARRARLLGQVLACRSTTRSPTSPLFIWDPRVRQGRARRGSRWCRRSTWRPRCWSSSACRGRRTCWASRCGETIADDTPVREAGLFGVHGGHVNVTDGRYVYMRAPVKPEEQPLFDYTLMPTHMRGPFSVQELPAPSNSPDRSNSPRAAACCHSLARRRPRMGPSRPLQNDAVRSRVRSAADDADSRYRGREENDRPSAAVDAEAHAPQELFARLGLSR